MKVREFLNAFVNSHIDYNNYDIKIIIINQTQQTTDNTTTWYYYTHIEEFLNILNHEIIKSDYFNNELKLFIN